jgi:phosphoribosylanthranilate isomerase
MQNLQELVMLKPDYIGFILYPESKRYVGDEFKLSVDIPETIGRVGVFVNEMIPRVMHWVSRLRLSHVQLHGYESPEYCQELKKMKIRVIKSFGIDESFSFDSMEPYLPYCDFFLFDTKSKHFGGTGEKFNWNYLTNYTFDKSFFLSGGISAEDSSIPRELLTMPLYAIDINSRFESDYGIKDINILKDFIMKFRTSNTRIK